MRVTALILGILGGLSGLSFASFASAALWVFSGVGMSQDQVALGQLLIWCLPLLAFLGAGLALAKPIPSAVALGSTILGYLIIASWSNTTFFVFTIMLLNGAGAALSLLSSQEPEHGRGPSATAPTISSTDVGPSATEILAYDRTKWNALVKYDREIEKIAQSLEPYGQRWVDMFAVDFLALNDKSYLPQIIQKIIAAARAEKEQSELERRAADDAQKRYEEELAEDRRKRKEAYEARVAYWKDCLFGTKRKMIRTASAVLLFVLCVGATYGAYQLNAAHVARLEEEARRTEAEHRAEEARRIAEENERRRMAEQRAREEQLALERERREKDMAYARSATVTLDLKPANIRGYFLPSDIGRAIDGFNFKVTPLDYRGVAHCIHRSNFGGQIYKPRNMNQYYQWTTLFEFEPDTDAHLHPRNQYDFEFLTIILNALRSAVVAQCNDQLAKGNLFIVDTLSIKHALEVPKQFEVVVPHGFTGSSLGINGFWDLQASN